MQNKEVEFRIQWSWLVYSWYFWVLHCWPSFRRWRIPSCQPHLATLLVCLKIDLFFIKGCLEECQRRSQPSSSTRLKCRTCQCAQSSTESSCTSSAFHTASAWICLNCKVCKECLRRLTAAEGGLLFRVCRRGTSYSSWRKVLRFLWSPCGVLLESLCC